MSGKERSIKSYKSEITRLKAKIFDANQEIERLKKCDRKNEEWISNAKKELGYHDNMSFDIVWEDVLAKMIAIAAKGDA